MLFEHVTDAIFTVLAVKNFVLLCAGVFAGIVCGAIPGLSVTMGVVLVLPFTFTLTPIEGMSTMLGVLVGGLSGGLISAALIGIPGTPGAVATTFDGLPMSRAGRPGLALALGLWASFFGGTISALLLVVLAPSLARIGLEFGPWEYFSLIAFALTIAASLSSENLIKGLIAAVIGLAVAAMGEDAVNGVARLTYGFEALDRGFGFLPILIGIFAFGQLLADVQDPNAARRPLMERGGKAVRLEHRAAISLIVRQWANLVRSSLVGMFIGILPAVGGTVSNIVAYDQAKKASRYPSRFGTGIPDGVIAPEAANNATAGGSLTILMALGIPGDAVAAVMLGALMIHNLVPSPSFVRDQPILAYGILFAFFLAHFVTVLLQSVAMRTFLLAMRVPVYVLAAIILAYCAIGAFALNNQVFDVWVIFGFGVLGYLMRILAFPAAPMILGVVLGSLAETNLARALTIDSNLLVFLMRPMSLLFLILAVFSAAFPWYQAQRDRGGWTRWYLPALTLLSGMPLLAMPGAVRPALGAMLIALAGWVTWRRRRGAGADRKDEDLVG